MRFRLTSLKPGMFVIETIPSVVRASRRWVSKLTDVRLSWDRRSGVKSCVSDAKLDETLKEKVKAKGRMDRNFMIFSWWISFVRRKRSLCSFGSKKDISTEDCTKIFVDWIQVITFWYVQCTTVLKYMYNRWISTVSHEGCTTEVWYDSCTCGRSDDRAYCVPKTTLFLTQSLLLWILPNPIKTEYLMSTLTAITKKWLCWAIFSKLRTNTTKRI